MDEGIHACPYGGTNDQSHFTVSFQSTINQSRFFPFRLVSLPLFAKRLRPITTPQYVRHSSPIPPPCDHPSSSSTIPPPQRYHDNVARTRKRERTQHMPIATSTTLFQFTTRLDGYAYTLVDTRASASPLADPSPAPSSSVNSASRPPNIQRNPSRTLR